MNNFGHRLRKRNKKKVRMMMNIKREDKKKKRSQIKLQKKKLNDHLDFFTYIKNY